MERLREVTRPEHQAIEVVLGMSTSRLTLARYRTVLARFLGFYEPLEGALRSSASPTTASELDLGVRCAKTALLRDDLRSFELDDRELDRCRDLPRIRTDGDVIGCLYVIEGATLGGSVIAKQVRATFGFGPHNGARFFHGYGENTGMMWQAFRAATARIDASGGLANDVTAAAVSTFQTLRRWCEQGLS